MAGRKRKSVNATAETNSESTEVNEKELNGNNEVNEQKNNSDAESDDSKITPKRDSKKRKKGSKTGKSAAKNAGVAAKTEPNFEVEAILDEKLLKGDTHYLIRWKGYSADDDTWEPESSLNCPDIIKKYLTTKKKSPTKGGDKKKNDKSKKPEQSDDEDENGEADEMKSPKKGQEKKPKGAQKGADKSSNEAEENGEKNHEKKSPKKTADKKKKDSLKKPLNKDKNDDGDKEEDNAEYEVEKIIEVHHKRNGEREFLVRWKGYSSKVDSWEPEDNLNCPDLISKFMDKVKSAQDVELRELRINRAPTDRFTLNPQAKDRRLSQRHKGKQRVHYHEVE